MAKTEELTQRIREHRWFHTMDLGDGFVTDGSSPHSTLIGDHMPEVGGLSVLDIGAWDGKWSWWAEAQGAKRVVALDHYIWRLDGRARARYCADRVAEGLLPDPEMIDNGFLSDALPGRIGFDLVHAYLDSGVEPVVGDLLTMDLSTIGSFDVVFYFGVLYHMVDPVGALRRLRQVTDGVAVIETAAIRVPTQPGASLVEFYPGAELGGDYGNWFAPTGDALVGMCLAAGFRSAEVKDEIPLVVPAPPPPERRRFRRSPEPPPPLYDRTRLVAHAYV